MSARSNRTGIFEVPENPDIVDLFKGQLRRLRLSMRTNTVGTVVAYNPATQQVTVTVDILQIIKVFNLPDPNAEAPTPPVILTNIPVVWPRAGTGYLTFPLVPGDTGTITIMDRSIDNWLLLGAPVDPISSATHALQDAVFEPGLHPQTNPIVPPTDLTGTVLHDDLAVKLGRLAALGVARLTDTTSANVDMTSWMVEVTAAIATMAALFNAAPGPVLSAPGTIPIFPTTLPTDFGVITSASAKVRSE